MNIGTIRKLVAAYLGKPLAEFNNTGVDMILHEINAARKTAELLHDWNQNRVFAKLSVAPTGSSIANAVLAEDDSAVNLKEFITFYLSTDGETFTPIYHHTKKNVAVWTKEQAHFEYFRGIHGESRYPSDADVADLPGLVPTQAYLHGPFITLAPTPETTQTIYIDGVKWMDDYIADTDTDWMVEHGHDYLKWAAICSLNYLNAKFVPGLDGNLPPPVKARDAALELLRVWDSFQIEQGRQPKGIR